jgi:hypothetical protein
MRRLHILLATLLVACAAGANGASDTTTAAVPASTSTAAAVTTTAPAGETTTSGVADGEGVPDACTLITAEELSQLLGVETGEGTPQGASPDRSICIYPAGVITAIEVADNYQASRDLIEDQGRSTEDVAGVGTAAFFDEAGQLVALGDRYFVAVTAPGEIAVLTVVAQRLLEGAGEAN